MTAALLLPLMPAACNVQLPDLIDIDSHGQNDRIYYPEHNRRDDYERERERRRERERDQYDAGGLIRTDRGECLDIHGDDKRSLIRYRCHGQSNQQFRFDSRSGTIRQNGRCLDVSGGETRDGSRVILFQCNGKDNQRWYFDGGRIRSADSGKCLDASENYLSIRSCSSSRNQQFYFSNRYNREQSRKHGSGSIRIGSEDRGIGNTRRERNYDTRTPEGIRLDKNGSGSVWVDDNH